MVRIRIGVNNYWKYLIAFNHFVKFPSGTKKKKQLKMIKAVYFLYQSEAAPVSTLLWSSTGLCPPGCNDYMRWHLDTMEVTALASNWTSTTKLPTKSAVWRIFILWITLLSVCYMWGKYSGSISKMGILRFPVIKSRGTALERMPLHWNLALNTLGHIYYYFLKVIQCKLRQYKNSPNLSVDHAAPKIHQRTALFGAFYDRILPKGILVNMG